jgi:glyoxylase-like metal-dependent hydrolase (beta-lactamase superfamily II)
MKIIPLSEGAFSIDKTKQFIPFDKDKDDLQQRAVGSLLVEIQPFCVVTLNDIIVIDTGLGFSNSEGVLQIHQNLLNNGIDPLAVTKVLISHLHKDHSGGISSLDKVLNQRFFNFPHAQYYVNKAELNDALQKENAPFSSTDFDFLANSDQVIITSEKGVIDNFITYEVVGGHSPHHQVFWIEEVDQKIFFGGDVAPQIQQMKSRVVAKYDFDGKKCMELRQQWWQQGQQENWTFLFYHDIKTPIFSFK